MPLDRYFSGAKVIVKDVDWERMEDVGGIPGGLAGAATRLLRRWMSPLRGALLGVALAVGLAVLWPVLFPFPVGTGAEVRAYLLWQGVPSVLSVAGGGWIGYWLGQPEKAAQASSGRPDAS